MKKSLENFIRKYVREYKKKERTITNWQEPLICYADAHDELFDELKNIVGQDHISPLTSLASANTVISYFVPFEEETVLSNQSGKIASRDWAFAYIETNRLIDNLGLAIKERLEKKGYATILPQGKNLDRATDSGNYSQRHIAYIAGMGTFGMNRLIITEKGCAGRFGSVITELKIEPTPRPEKEYCLYKVDKSCTDCIDACPRGALTVDGFDKQKCMEHMKDNQIIYRDLGNIRVCGKCVANARCRFEKF
ncbi:MAG: epoxyqueuosine reductase [Peptostreptococcaceae bacterium]|nr:epoxyqueuosine reductase [Peptostreptococcaceae bacterium]